MHYQSYVSFIAITLLVPTDAQVPEDGPPVECRPGSYMSKVSGRCVYCVAGRDFTDMHNTLDECLPCATCTGGRLNKSECTTTRNTICVCPDDHYEHADGCSPRQGGTADDVIAKLQVQISDAIKKHLSSDEQVFNRLSAQLRAHSGESRNLSLIADVASHCILGLKNDLIAGSQSQKDLHVAIIALILVAIVLLIIIIVVIILKNRQHIRGNSECGLQPQQQTRFGECASSMYRCLCVFIRPTLATDKREVATREAATPCDNPPPGPSESTINSPIGPPQTSPQSSTDSSTPTSQAGAGVIKKSEDAAHDDGAHDDRRMSQNKQDIRVDLDGADCGGAAGPYGKTATDNQAEASPIVDGGPDEAHPLLG